MMTDEDDRNCVTKAIPEGSNVNVDVIRDVSVSPAEFRDLACAYPFTTLAADGSLVCQYRRGTEKHSYDGVLVTQRSIDLGHNWSPPAILFDGQQRSPRQAAGSGGLCLCRDGSLLAVFSATEVTQPDAYVFSEEGFTQHKFVITAHSIDHGVFWEVGRYIDDSCLEKPLCPGSNPVVLADETLFIPGERHHASGQLGICASCSRDHGQTLEPVQDLIVDPSGELNFGDARFTMFDNGELLTMLWTFRQADEETVAVHRSVSSDDGRTWSTPQPVGQLGQITDPLALDGDTVLAVSNYRWSPDGIRLWVSRDRGVSWPPEESVQMWDDERQQMLAQPRPGQPAPRPTASGTRFPGSNSERRI
jgi:hypothetical protein